MNVFGLFGLCFFLYIQIYRNCLFFRIRRVENLEALTKLDVLDLHGNMVSVHQIVVFLNCAK